MQAGEQNAAGSPRPSRILKIRNWISPLRCKQEGCKQELPLLPQKSKLSDQTCQMTMNLEAIHWQLIHAKLKKKKKIMQVSAGFLGLVEQC